LYRRIPLEFYDKMVKVFVGNLARGANARELRKKFEEFGEVESCEVVKDFAFVHMHNPKDAVEAIAHLNRSTFEGRVISVEMGKDESRKKEIPNGVKLFISNVDPDANSDDLKALFEECGEVIECDIIKQFAFVHMRGGKAARKAIEELNGVDFSGRSITVELGKETGAKARRSGANEVVKLFVSNIDPKATPEQLRDLFEEFGVVTDCDIVRDYGFVHMRGEKPAHNALEALHRTKFAGRTISVEYGKAQRRDRRSSTRPEPLLNDRLPPVSFAEEALLRRQMMLEPYPEERSSTMWSSGLNSAMGGQLPLKDYARGHARARSRSRSRSPHAHYRRNFSPRPLSPPRYGRTTTGLPSLGSLDPIISQRLSDRYGSGAQLSDEVITPALLALASAMQQRHPIGDMGPQAGAGLGAFTQSRSYFPHDYADMGNLRSASYLAEPHYAYSPEAHRNRRGGRTPSPRRRDAPSPRRFARSRR
jgi:RNA recognition motif-containing protein